MVSFVRLFAETLAGGMWGVISSSREDDRFGVIDKVLTFGTEDEILTTARDLELEVNEDDIEELIIGHEDKLTIEELQEILNEEHQKHNKICLLLNKRKTKEDQCRHLPLKIF
ncbi:hypothetical protein TNCV_3362231 [Trichonephila clavipes]|nr:hypothetical protein TNCV_3362231 [Trichonephila clavipes]